MECVYCGESFREHPETAYRFVCRKTACRLEQESDMLCLTMEQAREYFSIADEDEAREYLAEHTSNKNLL